MPFEVVGGRRIHYQALGRDGPAVIMLHGGLFGTLASWYFTVAPVLARRRRVFMYDMAGHGLSERTPDGYGVRRMADDLFALHQRLAPGERAALVGHSFGAVTALRYAIEHPQRVDRLALVEAPLPVLTRRFLDDLRKTLRTNVVDKLSLLQKLRLLFSRNRGQFLLAIDAAKQQFGDSMTGSLPAAHDASLRSGGRRARRMLDQLDALVGRTALLDEVLAEPDIDDAELAACAIPVLLLYGTKTFDPIAQTGRRLARVMPAARLQLIKGGHQLQWEAPAALTAAIAEHLDA